MTRAANASSWLLARADACLTGEAHDAEHVRRVRVAVAQASLGFVFTLGMAVLYASMGSRVSAYAIAIVALGLLTVPSLLRRGVSVFVVGNAMVGLAFVATLVVVLRSGGLGSPAIAWNVLLPLSVYAVCGRASAIAWSALIAAGLVALYTAERSGVSTAQDFDAVDLATLRVIAYTGVVTATALLVWVLDGARVAALRAEQEAARALDRQRILDDMHDGLGSHLLGMLVEARAGTLGETELAYGLETCLDDLRLIVDSLDPLHVSLDAALGALRGRLGARCEALGLTLDFQVDEDVVASFDAQEGMHVLRAIQEMVTNALRHARANGVEVHIRSMGAAADRIEVAVCDDGRGLGHAHNPRGRGMKSLRARARKLGGELVVEPRSPGLRVAIVRPR